MLTISTNENNDFSLGNSGNLNTKTGIQAVLQNCQTAVQMLLREAIFQGQRGTPAFQTIWSGSPNFQQAEASIRNTILQVEGVTNINSFNYTSNNNIFSYNVEIQTNFGNGTVAGVINGL